MELFSLELRWWRSRSINVHTSLFVSCCVRCEMSAAAAFAVAALASASSQAVDEHCQMRHQHDPAVSYRPAQRRVQLSTESAPRPSITRRCSSRPLCRKYMPCSVSCPSVLERVLAVVRRSGTLIQMQIIRHGSLDRRTAVANVRDRRSGRWEEQSPRRRHGVHKSHPSETHLQSDVLSFTHATVLPVASDSP